VGGSSGGRVQVAVFSWQFSVGRWRYSVLVGDCGMTELRENLQYGCVLNGGAGRLVMMI